MSNSTAVYDSCVLYPAPLRDLLIDLAVTDLFRARWTDAIHDEWIRNVLNDRPDLTQDQLERTRRLMNDHVRDALVVGFESLIPPLMLPDLDDRHVLAAAIRCGADVIVTFNTRHFPGDALRPFGIEARVPDDFLTDQLDLAENVVIAAVKRTRERLKNPPKTVQEYLETLDRQRLPNTVSILRRFAARL
jgi:hypothetical protein